MTTNERGAETVLLGREVGGDEREDVQRDAVDGDEGVLPLANGRQCGRSIPVESRNRVRGETVEVVRMLFFIQSDFPRRTAENMPRVSTPR